MVRRHTAPQSHRGLRQAALVITLSCWNQKSSCWPTQPPCCLAEGVLVVGSRSSVGSASFLTAQAGTFCWLSSSGPALRGCPHRLRRPIAAAFACSSSAFTRPSISSALEVAQSSQCREVCCSLPSYAARPCSIRRAGVQLPLLNEVVYSFRTFEARFGFSPARLPHLFQPLQLVFGVFQAGFWLVAR